MFVYRKCSREGVVGWNFCGYRYVICVDVWIMRVKRFFKGYFKESFKGGELIVGLLDICVYFGRIFEYKGFWVNMLDMLGVF